YDLYLTSPEEVDAELVALFEQYGAPVDTTAQAAVATTGAANTGDIQKVLAAVQLADAIRQHGHLAADIYPLHNQNLDTTRIETSAYNLTDADLREVPASVLLNNVPANVNNGLD